MRLLLIGSPRERARLRARLPADVEVVAEASALAAARALDVDADGWLIAAGSGGDGLEGEDGDGAVEALTAREREVLALMAEGFSNRRIGDTLGISDQTVKFHVAAICGKLGAANRTEAVRRGIERGLVAL